MRQSIAAIALALLTWPALATEPKLIHVELLEANALPEASADCSSGTVYDDGVFNDFYGVNPAYVVMRFDLPLGTTVIDQVCACFARAPAGADTTLPFDVVVFDNNGSGGSPGTFLGSVAATATGIPVVGNSDFYSVNLENSGISLPDTSVYVGVHFNSANHYVCGDRSAGTTQRDVYHSYSGDSWTSSSSPTQFGGAGPRAWGIRVEAAATSTTCTPTSEALCLDGGRFKVTATYETTSASSGNAQAVKFTDETGYFWFFESPNVEAVVKVHNGCSYNNHYWIFAGGLTNVRTVITVTDTKSGLIKTYVNPQGTAFAPIQDTSAFATCP